MTKEQKEKLNRIEIYQIKSINQGPVLVVSAHASLLFGAPEHVWFSCTAQDVLVACLTDKAKATDRDIKDKQRIYSDTDPVPHDARAP
jgi:hypothetical protein